MAKKAAGKKPDKPRRRRRVSVLSVTVVLLVCTAAAAIGWASLTYQAPEKMTQAAAPAMESAKAESGNDESAETPTSVPTPAKTEGPAEPVATNDSITALTPAPDPALVRPTANGPLPKVDAQGRVVRTVYARPFTTDNRPLVAIVVTGLGLNEAMTSLAINDLPPAVTLAFSPYGKDLQQDANRARARGHEVMLELPMEPVNYPQNDSGPWSLLATAPARINVLQAEKSMGRFVGYFGVINAMGGVFTESDIALRPVFELLHKSGLMFLDRRSSSQSVAIPVADSMNLPRAYVNYWLDQEPTVTAIEQRLADLRNMALREGYAIGLTELYPNSAKLLSNWLKDTASMGVTLAPVSAITNKQGRP